jgi:hypothetical protein
MEMPGIIDFPDQCREILRDSPLYRHALNELDAAGWGVGDLEVSGRASLLGAVAGFVTADGTGCPWSGGSIESALVVLYRLLAMRALSPLTDRPEEWMHISDEMAGQSDFWQSKRNSACFSHDGGVTYYNLDELPVRGAEWWRVATWRRRFLNRWFDRDLYIDTYVSPGKDKAGLRKYKSDLFEAEVGGADV